jgi:hypothetical protein
VFAMATISLVTLLVCRGLFGLWFTDIDTFPLIATGRIDSVSCGRPEAPSRQVRYVIEQLPQQLKSA